MKFLWQEFSSHNFHIKFLISPSFGHLHCKHQCILWQIKNINLRNPKVIFPAIVWRRPSSFEVFTYKSLFFFLRPLNQVTRQAKCENKWHRESHYSQSSSLQCVCVGVTGFSLVLCVSASTLSISNFSRMTDSVCVCVFRVVSCRFKVL